MNIYTFIFQNETYNKLNRLKKCAGQKNFFVNNY